MITREKAKELIEKRFPDRAVYKIGNYKDSYLIIAPGKELGPFNDTTNPYYTVNKKTGAIARFSPAQDFEGYRNAFKED